MCYKHAMRLVSDLLGMAPALWSTLAAFGLILLLARLRVPLALAVLGGAAALAAMMRVAPGAAVKAAAGGATQPTTLALAGIIVLLLTLSEMMRAGGQLDEIVSLVRALLRRPAVAMAALPALIGLLPMPGGALFSAPMVKSAAGQTQVPPGWLSAINYWFRHIWEYWWPLYPGVILATILTRIDLGTFAAFQMPMGVMMIVSGLLVFRKSHPDLHAAAGPPAPGTKRKLLRATSSIWLIMLVWVVVTAGMWLAMGAPPRKVPGGPDLTARQAAIAFAFKFVPITLGLVASLAWTARMNRLDRTTLRGVLAAGRTYSLVGLVVAVMVFRAMLTEAGAARGMADDLQRMRVPMTLVIAALPFIAGAVTGIAMGFVGVSFPIVLELAQGDPALRAYAVLAYGFGMVGMMLSPLHVCQIVSNRYFETTYGPVYRRMLPSAAAMGAMVTAYFLVLRMVMNR